MNSAAPAGHEKMVIQTSESGGQLRLFPGTNQIVLVSVNNGSVWNPFRSTDSGDSWEELPSSFPAILSGASNKTNASVSFNNTYYHISDPSIVDGSVWMTTSSNGGNTWNYRQFSTVDRRYTEVSASRDGKYGVATCGGWNTVGDAIKTNDFGQTWTREFSGAWWWNNFVDSTGENQLIGNLNGSIKYSNDFGENWNNFSQPLTSLGGAMVSGDGNYKVVWELYRDDPPIGARVHVSTDWTNWTTEDSSTSVRLSGGCISNDGKYMLIPSSDMYNSPEPYINVSYNYGQDWNKIDVTGGTSQYFSGSAMSSDGKYMIVIGGQREASNKSFKSIDYGHTWEEITDIPAGSYNQVRMSKNGRYVYVSGNGNRGLYYSQDYMATWQHVFDGSTCSGVFINF